LSNKRARRGAALSNCVTNKQRGEGWAKAETETHHRQRVNFQGVAFNAFRPSAFGFQLSEGLLRWLKGRVIDLIDYENEKLHADNDAGREMSNNIIKNAIRRAFFSFPKKIL